MNTEPHMHIACINCTHSGGQCTEIPPGWTRVREFPPEDEDDTNWWTHVGYCPLPECQIESSEEAKCERLNQEEKQ